ncbi:NADP-dependent oxidoreductase [Nocardioides speluncae]|uniref:NADP-dependent oxidoreductase n=1 Tax=Nocardioides speluncae TaxID=2670337 RepID=UPI000D68D700|nr:NADP-dependent oxidoreductase [Nocardioides speluncae]
MTTAFVFTEYGGPEVQELREIPEPSPAPGEVRVRVRAAAVNPVDWKLRAGWHRDFEQRDFPSVLGRTIAGVVDGVGAGVTDFAVGDEVFGATDAGGYATQTAVTTALLAHKPSAVSFTDAATLPVSSATAHNALSQVALPTGTTLLVTGAGGGVGVPLVQLAVRAGLTVVGTASPAKQALLTGLGAVHVSSAGTADEVADRIRAAAPNGVDAVIDTAGGDALDIAAPFAPVGRLVSVGEDRVADLGGAVVDRAQAPAREVLDELAALVEKGELVPVVQVYPFAEAAAALADVEAGHTTGRAVLEIG